MAEDFSRLDEQHIIARIIQMGAADWPFRIRDTAVYYVGSYHDIAASAIDEATFSTYVGQLAALLTVNQPSIPDNEVLLSMSKEDLVTLASDLELAAWDDRQRRQALAANERYWLARLGKTAESETPEAPPSVSTYAAHFRTIADYLRAARGLSPIS